MNKLNVWFVNRLAEASSRGGIGMIITGMIMLSRNRLDSEGVGLIVGGIAAFCTKEGNVGDSSWFLNRLKEPSSRGGIGMIIVGVIMMSKNITDAAGVTLVISGIVAFCTPEAKRETAEEVVEEKEPDSLVGKLFKLLQKKDK